MFLRLRAEKMLVLTIALLANILLLVFAHAPERARIASWLSNMEQFGTVLQMDVDDCDTLNSPRGYTIVGRGQLG
ncbi:hypothetical protein IAD21_01635 [Abditibacteriota bacterium]|nr:hypothetical protein IAD21_01635 [Abditibacteriota bacterium]